MSLLSNRYAGVTRTHFADSNAQLIDMAHQCGMAAGEFRCIALPRSTMETNDGTAHRPQVRAKAAVDAIG